MSCVHRYLTETTCTVPLETCGRHRASSPDIRRNGSATDTSCCADLVGILTTPVTASGVKNESLRKAGQRGRSQQEARCSVYRIHARVQSYRWNDGSSLTGCTSRYRHHGEDSLITQTSGHLKYGRMRASLPLSPDMPGREDGAAAGRLFLIPHGSEGYKGKPGEKGP